MKSPKSKGRAKESRRKETKQKVPEKNAHLHLNWHFSKKKKTWKETSIMCAIEWHDSRVNEQWMVIIWWNYSSISVPLMLRHGWPATTVQHHIDCKHTQFSNEFNFFDKVKSLVVETGSRFCLLLCDDNGKTMNNVSFEEVRQYVNCEWHGIAWQKG